MSIRHLCLWLALVLMPALANAQTFPALTGRVVDDAHLLDPAQVQALTQKLAGLEQQSGRQLVVVTVPSLQGYDIADYGYQLGRAWGIGAKAENDGSLLIVAPDEHRVRIEAGYGLEPILTDAMSSIIINNTIVPKFKADDYAGGINAGVDEIAKLLLLPPDEARKRAAQIAKQTRDAEGDGNIGGAIFVILFVLLFVVLPMARRARGVRSYDSDGSIWPILLWDVLSSRGGRDDDDHWGGWGGGGGWGGSGGGGGFTGGGGSFGGGGASGSW